MVLETTEERVRLLKAGYTGKQIETVYVEMNGFRVVKASVLFERSNHAPTTD